LGKFRSILFRAIVVDPPWPYDDQGSRVAARRHYDTMTLDALATLPVSELAAADGCHLYLWVTNSFMRRGYDLLDAWGFREKTIITWVKQTKSGEVNFGFGHYFRNATEHIIFAARENMPTLRDDQPNVLFDTRAGHSKKPESIYSLVELMSPPPYLELFSRERHKGWSVWGNEVGVISESY
jgi:N6-adenosine-specific RNA methylase IME4